MKKQEKCSFTAKPHYKTKAEAVAAHPCQKVTRCARCRMWEPKGHGRRR